MLLGLWRRARAGADEEVAMPGPKNPDTFEFEKVSVEDARQVLDDSVKPVYKPATPKVDHESKRKSGGPAEALRTATLQWILKLPPHVQPRHLQVRYPRIANRMAADWDKVAVCEEYL